MTSKIQPPRIEYPDGVPEDRPIIGGDNREPTKAHVEETHAVRVTNIEDSPEVLTAVESPSGIKTHPA